MHGELTAPKAMLYAGAHKSKCAWHANSKAGQRHDTRVVDWRLACTMPPRMPLKARMRYSGSAHFIRIAADMFLRCSSARTRLSAGAPFCPLFDEGRLAAGAPATSAALEVKSILRALVSVFDLHWLFERANNTRRCQQRHGLLQPHQLQEVTLL